MCCPTYNQLTEDHIHCLNRMRTAPSHEEAIANKSIAATAWTAVVQHRRCCTQCQRCWTEMQSSAGMPAWQSGLY